MKIRPEHYKLLEDRFVAYLARHPEIDIADVNATMRKRWDLYWKVGGFSNAQEYQYLDDANIDTAIRAILQSQVKVSRVVKKGPLYPHIPKSKNKPTRYDVEIKTWQERDRASVIIQDKRTGKTVMEWWDEAVGQMFEDGFFKGGMPRDFAPGNISVFENSVLSYAEDMGMLSK